MINFRIYSVYYMNNDGRKEFVGTKLSYESAQKTKQQYATKFNIYLFLTTENN